MWIKVGPNWLRKGKKREVGQKADDPTTTTTSPKTSSDPYDVCAGHTDRRESTELVLF